MYLNNDVRRVYMYFNMFVFSQGILKGKYWFIGIKFIYISVYKFLSLCTLFKNVESRNFQIHYVRIIYKPHNFKFITLH